MMSINYVSCSIAEQLKRDFLTYSNAIYNRALPDAVDGLKVAQRRSLLGIRDLNLSSAGSYCKVSRLEGHVLGRYHPNGSCSSTIVNLGQQAANRYVLTDIHGNAGGSIQSGPAAGQLISEDQPAAARYLEVRASAMAEGVFLSQIDRKLGDWRPNYDGSCSEPVRIVPALPALLITGAQGIASGYACNHIAYNIADVAAATSAYIANKTISDCRLLAKFSHPPEVPQGGRVVKTPAVSEVLKNGRGQVEVYGRWHTEDRVKYGKRAYKPAIVITSLASGSSERFIDKVHELADRDKIQGVLEASDQSTREGIRVVIVLKDESYTDSVLATLIEHTGLRHTHNVNCVAVNTSGKPETFGVRKAIECWYKERVKYLAAKHSLHVEGLRSDADKLSAVCSILTDVDKFLRIVKKAKTKPEAVQAVSRGWKLPTHLAEYVISIPISTIVGSEIETVKGKLSAVQNDIAALMPLCAPGPDLDKHIIAEVKSLKGLGGESRSEWIDSVPATGVVKAPAATDAKAQMVAEGAGVGLSARFVNRWIREAMGRGGMESRWRTFIGEWSSRKQSLAKLHTGSGLPSRGEYSWARFIADKDTLTVGEIVLQLEKWKEAYGNSRPDKSNARATGSGRSRSGKAAAGKQPAGTARKKQRSSGRGKSPVAAPARSSGRGSRSRTPRP